MKKMFLIENNKRSRIGVSGILACVLALSLCLCACDLPFGKQEEKQAAITEAEDVTGEMPTIIVHSQESFAEDVTEEEKAAAMQETEAAEAAEGISNEPPAATVIDKLACEPGAEVYLDPAWEYASFSKIHDGCAIFYAATENRCGLVVGVNAGHGTKGGTEVKTFCHPDQSAKVTGGATAAGSIEAVAVSAGMTFTDGTPEAKVTLRLAQALRDQLLAAGYDVLMIRDGDDVQLDNVARTVICNNVADCHVSIHFDGDGQSSDKGCFFASVPDAVKSMQPVEATWHMSEELGAQIIKALGNDGFKICNGGSMDLDLTQTSYSTIPSVDVEYGNQCTDISDENLSAMAAATVKGIDAFFDVSN